MSIAFCNLITTRRPLSLLGAGSTTTMTVLVAPITVNWQSGAPDSWLPDGFSVTSAYDGSKTVDTTAWTWLVVAVQGVANSARLIKEQDYGNLGGTVLSGATCQALYRINGTDYELFQQAGSGTGGALELTDGTHDLTVVTKITVTGGGLVGGTSAAATLSGMPPGTAAGDLPYWDGSVWAILPIPSS
jgi:hypothetical protein